MSNPFYRLAPFIQEWIYNRRWEELREAQIEACRVLFDTDDHLLIATGTASGKTEAAFFPYPDAAERKPVAQRGHSVHRPAQGAHQRPV